VQFLPPKEPKAGILKAIGSQGKETTAQQFAPTPASMYFNDPEKTVFFNESRTWYKDIYNLLWDLELKENCYLVF
jgi:hypothetical protein